MKRKISHLLSATLFCLVSMGACNTDKSDEPQNPIIPENPIPDPTPTKSDTLSIKIGCKMLINEEKLEITRSGSNDLFGVNIYQVKPDGTTYSGGERPYASGVFDDIDKMVFKFVKGNTYTINVLYLPDAKNIVYRYPNGTYGYPFSSIYGLQDYIINEAVYDQGKQPENGFTGEILNYIFEVGYQTNASGLFMDSFKTGTTPRYCGVVYDYTVLSDDSLVVPLDLYVSAIKLNIDNFNEGTVSLRIHPGSVDPLNIDYNPDDEMEQSFWISGPAQLKRNPNEEFLWSSVADVRIFYTKPNGEKYLLATKNLDCKPAIKYVFNFNLEEREDGSIGILIKNSEFNEEISYFD